MANSCRERHWTTPFCLIFIIIVEVWETLPLRKFRIWTAWIYQDSVLSRVVGLGVFVRMWVPIEGWFIVLISSLINMFNWLSMLGDPCVSHVFAGFYEEDLWDFFCGLYFGLWGTLLKHWKRIIFTKCCLIQKRLSGRISIGLHCTDYIFRNVTIMIDRCDKKLAQKPVTFKTIPSRSAWSDNDLQCKPYAIQNN